jgi:hypothetical protein
MPMFRLKSNKMKYKIPRKVKLEIHDSDALRKDRQDSAFYVWGDSSEVASLTYRDQTYTVVCVGQMRIHYREEVIRYTDQLINAGIRNDEDMAKIEVEGGEWINNSWFEIFDENTHTFTEEVYHEVKDAIEGVAEGLKYNEMLPYRPEQAVDSVKLRRWQKVLKRSKHD